MRSLLESRRVCSMRRASATVLTLLVLAPLLGLISSEAQASAGDARATGDRKPSTSATAALLTEPGLVGRHLPRAAQEPYNPDTPVLPVSCRPPAGYVEPEPCRLVPHKPGAPLIIVWGDSHAWQMTPAIRRAVGKKNVNVVSLLQGGCPAMDSDLSTPAKNEARNSCDDFGHLALDFIDKARRAKRPVRVIVAIAWELYHNVTDPPNGADERYPGTFTDYLLVNARKSVNGTPRAFKALARMRVKTDIVAAMPMIYSTAPECPRGPWRCPLPRQAVLKDAAENNAQIRKMRSMLSVRGSIIRPAKSLCDKEVCRGEIDGLPTYWDPLHIGQRVSYRLAPHFAPTVASVLREAAALRRRSSR